MVECKGCGHWFRREDVADPNTNPTCTACGIQRIKDAKEKRFKSLCYHCGEACSGDVTETIEIEGMVGEFAICDSPDDCKENKS